MDELLNNVVRELEKKKLRKGEICVFSLCCKINCNANAKLINPNFWCMGLAVTFQVFFLSHRGVGSILQHLWINVNIHVNVILLQCCPPSLFFPDQVCKMAAAAGVSSGSPLPDKCLPQYISTAMKTKVFWRRALKGQARGGRRFGSRERVILCSKGNKAAVALSEIS